MSIIQQCLLRFWALHNLLALFNSVYSLRGCHCSLWPPSACMVYGWGLEISILENPATHSSCWLSLAPDATSAQVMSCEWGESWSPRISYEFYNTGYRKIYSITFNVSLSRKTWLTLNGARGIVWLHFFQKAISPWKNVWNFLNFTSLFQAISMVNWLICCLLYFLK